MEKKETERLIEEYVGRNITAEDRIILMALVEQTPDLRNDIEARMDLVQSLKYIGNEELKSKLANIHRIEQNNMPSKDKSQLIKWGVIILSIASLVVGSAFLYNTYFKKVSSDQMYATYYEPYNASFNTRSNESVGFSELKTAYDEESYQIVVDKVNHKLNTEIEDRELLLAVGISAIETGEVELGRLYFEAIINKADFFYIDHARWYLALSLIKGGEKEKGQPLLEKIVNNPKANHHKQAKKLLAMLE